MITVTLPELCHIHPFAPYDQVFRYHEMITELNTDLARITGFAAVSTQPNTVATGEYAGLLASLERLAGAKVVVVENDNAGQIDYDDLLTKIAKHKNDVAAFMDTHPSTFGVFDERIVDSCNVIHKSRGQVYMDGANMII
jgi:glycine dehydrogenase